MQTRDQDVNPAAGRVGARESPVLRPEHAESSFTRLLEQQAAKIPSDLFLSAAIAARQSVHRDVARPAVGDGRLQQAGQAARAPLTRTGLLPGGGGWVVDERRL
jgi:hypothetical protein